MARVPHSFGLFCPLSPSARALYSQFPPPTGTWGAGGAAWPSPRGVYIFRLRAGAIGILTSPFMAVHVRRGEPVRDIGRCHEHLASESLCQPDGVDTNLCRECAAGVRGGDDLGYVCGLCGAYAADERAVPVCTAYLDGVGVAAPARVCLRCQTPRWGALPTVVVPAPPHSTGATVAAAFAKYLAKHSLRLRGRVAVANWTKHGLRLCILCQRTFRARDTLAFRYCLDDAVTRDGHGCLPCLTPHVYEAARGGPKCRTEGCYRRAYYRTPWEPRPSVCQSCRTPHMHVTEKSLGCPRCPDARLAWGPPGTLFPVRCVRCLVPGDENLSGSLQEWMELLTEEAALRENGFERRRADAGHVLHVYVQAHLRRAFVLGPRLRPLRLFADATPSPLVVFYVHVGETELSPSRTAEFSRTHKRRHLAMALDIAAGVAADTLVALYAGHSAQPGASYDPIRMVPLIRSDYTWGLPPSVFSLQQ